jgi:hypothetical protein
MPVASCCYDAGEELACPQEGFKFLYDTLRELLPKHTPVLQLQDRNDLNAGLL